jgi:hypothetical protein
VLISAAVCPHPPILVPELAGEAACELDGLRAACRRAISRLFSGDYDALTMVKLREVADGLEEAADALEPVAHAVETIAVNES